MEQISIAFNSSQPILENQMPQNISELQSPVNDTKSVMEPNLENKMPQNKSKDKKLFKISLILIIIVLILLFLIVVIVSFVCFTQHSREYHLTATS
jgi:cytoskeletal protein RodZ